MPWIKTEDKPVSPIIQHLKVQVIVGDSRSTLRAAGREGLGLAETLKSSCLYTPPPTRPHFLIPLSSPPPGKQGFK